MLSEVATDLYTAQDALRFPGGVRLSVRMTVIRLAGGELAVHSPVAPTPGLLDAVAALGPVRHVLAPNLYHHMFVRPWLDRFPEARALGAPGLARKRPDLPWAGQLGARDCLPGLEATLLAGAPRLHEVVFFHPRSRSLVVSDLLFHMVGPQSLANRLVLTLAGTLVVWP